jgi:hypothetical protein
MPEILQVPLGYPDTSADGGDGGDSSPREVTYVYTYERDSSVPEPPEDETVSAVVGANTPRAYQAVGYGREFMASVYVVMRGSKSSLLK